MDQRKVIYYTDELKDEFSTAVIKARPIDENYNYDGVSPGWKLKRLWWYWIFAIPVAKLYMKIVWGHKIINKKVLKPYKGKPTFTYANHTNPTPDALIPTMVSIPWHGTFVIVHANNVSIPYLGRVTPYLGALPLPDNLKAARNFNDAIKLHVKENGNIMIYPEAHIWPFYTKIRPFIDASFKYPVDYKAPVFCFTNTYQKRRFRKTPRMVTYVEGPFFADETLSSKEARKKLRDQVYEAMVKNAAHSNVELIQYIKKENETAENQTAGDTASPSNEKKEN